MNKIKSYKDILIGNSNDSTNNNEINHCNQNIDLNKILDNNYINIQDIKQTTLESRLKILEQDFPISWENKTFEEKLTHYCANGMVLKIKEIPKFKLTKELVNSKIKFMVYKCNEIDLWITNYININDTKDENLLNEFCLRKHDIKLCIEYMIKLFH